MVETRTLRVGIIGASADAGWARVSHVPAIKTLGGLELAAVANRDQESADAAAKAYDIPAAFGDALAMIRDPAIELVSVVVRVPAHREYVLAAIAAGKHVYCEWPLGRNTAEADEMLQAARVGGVKVAIGLEARGLPALQRARALIASGAIGRVLSARVLSATVAWGPKLPEAERYAEDPKSGVDLQTVQERTHSTSSAPCWANSRTSRPCSPPSIRRCGWGKRSSRKHVSRLITCWFKRASLGVFPSMLRSLEGDLRRHPFCSRLWATKAC